MSLICSRCRVDIKAGLEHRHQSKVLCENCDMDVRTAPARKPHWQYLKSIKTEYLIPARKGKTDSA